MELNIDEALRYLGVREAADGPLHRQMSALAKELQGRTRPRAVWRAFDLAPDSEFRIPHSEFPCSLPPSML